MFSIVCRSRLLLALGMMIVEADCKLSTCCFQIRQKLCDRLTAIKQKDSRKSAALHYNCVLINFGFVRRF